MNRYIKKFLQVLILSLMLSLTSLMADMQKPAVISLIIDDMGNNPDSGIAALKLPGDVSYSILPNTQFATVLAEMAHAKGKQILVHLPMEAEHHRRLGPNGLLLNMPESDYKAMVYNALQSVPYAVGMNNHMGSLLTQHQQPMQWLMHILLEHKFFFLDSRTTAKTVAQQTASSMGVKTFRRDVFLDNSRKQEDIQKQFEQLIILAKRKGYATGIAHPYPETISVLSQQLPALEEKGVKLVFASELIDRLENNNVKITQRSTIWDVSSSPLHKVVRN